MQGYKLGIFLLYLFLMSSPVISQSQEFTTDTANEWSQGTFTKVEERSGTLQLDFAAFSDGDNETFLSRSNDSEIFAYNLIRNETYGLGIQGVPGDIGDFDSDGDRELSFIDQNSNLKYYHFDGENSSDTNVNADEVGAAVDVGNDGDLDIFIEQSSNNNLGYYDSGDDSVTDIGYSNVRSVGFAGDIGDDGDMDVPFGFEGGGDNWNIYFYDVGSGKAKPLIKDSTAQEYAAFDVYDFDGDDIKEVLFRKTNEANLYTIDTSDNSTADTGIDVYNNEEVVGEVGSLDSSGGEDIPHASSALDSFKAYDTDLASSTTFLGTAYLSIGPTADVGYPRSGSYTSQSFNAGELYSWDNITIGGLERPGNSVVNVTIETSNNNFSSVAESKTFQNADLNDGTATYNLSLDSGTQYARVDIWLERGSTPDIGNYTLRGKDHNDLPNVDKQRLHWSDIGGSNTRILEYGISDPNGNEISSHNSPPSGSESAFTNSTYNVSQVGTVFDYIPLVTDFKGATGDGLETNYTLSSALYFENASGTVNESFQAIRTNATIDNRGNNLNYSVSDSPPAVLKDIVVDGDTISNNGLSGSVTVSWQYLVDRITTQTFTEEKDSSQTSTIDTQYLVRHKQVENNLSSQFTRLKIDPVSTISGSCSNCNQRTITVNGNSKKNLSYNSSGDFLTSEKEFAFTPNPETVTLGIDYKGRRNFQIKENQDFTWNGINITQNVTEPQSCTQSNNSEVNVAASSFQNYTVEFNCNPGSIGSPTQNVVSISNGDRIWINSTDMDIKSNHTEDTVIQINTSKSQWQDSDNYDGGSLEAYVEGQNSDGDTALNVSDTGTHFQITIGTNFQSSSLHTTDNDWSITYTSTTDSGGGGSSGGGSSGGGTTIIESGDDNQTTFTFSNPIFSLQPGGEQTRSFFVTHTGDQTADVQVTVPFKDDQPACQFFRIQTRHPLENETVQYGRTGTYTMQPGSQGLVGKYTRPIGIRIDLPENRTKVEKLSSDGSITCTFITSADTGQAGEFTARIRVIENPVVQFFATFFDQILNWLGGIL